MAVAQLSVFIESKVGHLKRVLEVFVENDISVKGYALSDTGDYGIARFVVDKRSALLKCSRRRVWRSSRLMYSA